MKIYFLSSQPCALTVNGAYFGITDLFARTTDLDLRDNLFVEFLPENAQPIRFFITEQIRFSPPEHCEVYLLPDAIAIYARDFAPTDLTFRLIRQEKCDDCVATLYAQGHLYLSVQTEKGFFNAYLPPCFAQATLFFPKNLILLTTSANLALFNRDGKRLLQEKIRAYALEGNELSARLPLLDSLGRYADCKWELTENGCTQTQFVLGEYTAENAEKPSDGLLAYAFFESILIGADFTPFLADELIPDKENIRAFLGDFTAVTLTNEPTVCGLVRKKKDRLFTVEYYSVEIQDGKLVDVKG